MEASERAAGTAERGDGGQSCRIPRIRARVAQGPSAGRQAAGGGDHVCHRAPCPVRRRLLARHSGAVFHRWRRRRTGGGDAEQHAGEQWRRAKARASPAAGPGAATHRPGAKNCRTTSVRRGATGRSTGCDRAREGQHGCQAGQPALRSDPHARAKNCRTTSVRRGATGRSNARERAGEGQAGRPARRAKARASPAASPGAATHMPGRKTAAPLRFARAQQGEATHVIGHVTC